MAQDNSNGIFIGKDDVGHSAVISKTAYEGTVIARAMERAGHNPHLKGHIHEIWVKDAHNESPRSSWRPLSLSSG